MDRPKIVLPGQMSGDSTIQAPAVAAEFAGPEHSDLVRKRLPTIRVTNTGRQPLEQPECDACSLLRCEFVNPNSPHGHERLASRFDVPASVQVPDPYEAVGFEPSRAVGSVTGHRRVL
jgi:hypothetical protein